jgi:hypothetical protein
MRYFVIFLVLIGLGFSTTDAQYSGNLESYSFFINETHEIRFSSHATQFEGIFYDNNANSIIASVNSDDQLSDTVLIYLHSDSFYELLNNGMQATPTDVLILLDGQEQEYDVLPTRPRNDYMVWEFKSMPNIKEIEMILTPEPYMENKLLSPFENSFSIIESQVRYDMFYDISNASINSVRLNCDSASFTLYLASDGDGSLQLDIPNGMLGGIFMILVDGKEWNDASIDKNVLTVNFFEGTSIIEVLGSYNFGTDIEDGVCDVVHDPPYSYILSPLKQIKAGIDQYQIKCKPDFYLVYKYNGYPVCVLPESVPKLIQRNWMEIENVTSESSRLCYSIPETGLCKAAIEKYYFDWETNSCKSFTWGGCDGKVPFDTMELCQGLCGIENED